MAKMTAQEAKEKECLAETMKSSVAGIVDSSISSLEREISKNKAYLQDLKEGKVTKEKKQITFEIDSMRGLIDINDRLLNYYKGILKSFNEIPTCEEKYA